VLPNNKKKTINDSRRPFFATEAEKRVTWNQEPISSANRCLLASNGGKEEEEEEEKTTHPSSLTTTSPMFSPFYPQENQPSSSLSDFPPLSAAALAVNTTDNHNDTSNSPPSPSSFTNSSTGYHDNLEADLTASSAPQTLRELTEVVKRDFEDFNPSGDEPSTPTSYWKHVSYNLLVNIKEWLMTPATNIRFKGSKKTRLRKTDAFRVAFTYTCEAILEAPHLAGPWLVFFLLAKGIFHYSISSDDQWKQIDFLRTKDFLGFSKFFLNKPVPPTARDSTELSVKQIHNLVAKHIRNGNFRKAGNQFERGKVLPLNDATFDMLLQKHPVDSSSQPFTQEADELIRASTRHSSMVIKDEDLLAAVKNLGKGLAPGADGWRFEFFKMLFLSKSATARRTNFLAIVNKILQGHLHPLLKPIFMHTRLIPLAKDEGVRPIAIGGCLRRLVSKIVVRVLKTPICNFFEPYQVGVSYNGTETVVHTMQSEWTMGKTIGTVDLKNAFNSFFRARSCLLVAQHFSEAYKYVSLCYGKPLELSLEDGSSIPSVRGAQQGDPLAPWLFGLVIQDAILETKAKHSEVTIVAYCDDVTFAGNPREVESAMNSFIESVREVGLNANVSKSRIYQHMYHDPYDSDFDVSRVDGLPLLGGFIGSDDYISEQLNEVAEKHRVRTRKVLAFGETEPHKAYHLYKKSTIAKITSMLRKVATSQEFFTAIDDTSLLFIYKLINIDEEEPANNLLHRAACHLPVKLGGFGIPAIHLMHEPALAASLIECRRLANQLLPNCNMRFIEARIRSLREILPKTPLDEPERHLQKQYLKFKMDEYYQTMKAYASRTGRYDHIWFQAKGGRFSRWLNIEPREWEMTNLRFTTLARIWIGVKETYACVCKKNRHDLEGALACKSGPWVIRRHNSTYRLIGSFLKLIPGVQVEYEPSGFTGPHNLEDEEEKEPERLQTRADMRVTGLFEEETFTDLVITSPWAGNKDVAYRPSQCERVRTMELTKSSLYGRARHALPKGAKFVPLGFEALGVAGTSSNSFVDTIVDKLRPFNRRVFVNSLTKKIANYIFLVTRGRVE
jgi:hypothetical protein